MADNLLIDDDLTTLLLDEIVGLDALLELPGLDAHDRLSCVQYVDACRRFARERLLPSYGPMDRHALELVDGDLALHPDFGPLFRELAELGAIAATRPAEVGGSDLPLSVAAIAHAHLMAGNLGVYALAGLTTGAARLIESFGDDATRALFMTPMYEGRWTGTMALTEPQAGSSLADVALRARPSEDGRYRLEGTKIFISGGAHDVAENLVHLTLARIEGAPAGTGGVSLFAVPARRPEGDRLVPNDVRCVGVFHKIGWRALPSVQLAYGEAGDCHGWLIGPPNRGVAQMFQMMNEARLMVGFNAAATASVAYHEALAYARERPQGRPLGVRDASRPQVPIVEHADVRRMLLRQKAIVEGSLALLAHTARLADEAERLPDAEARTAAHRLLDLLVPIAKTFPAERGFEANSLAIQVLGGYGYTTEYRPEAWWRDQKLNSIHEGTSGIQALDLLGRKAIAGGGVALGLLAERVRASTAQARALGLEDPGLAALEDGVDALLRTTAVVGQRGAAGDVEAMLRHAADYLDAASCLVVGWALLDLARAATARRLGREGRVAAWRYWASTELVRVPAVLERVESGETSFATLSPDAL